MKKGENTRRGKKKRPPSPLPIADEKQPDGIDFLAKLPPELSLTILERMGYSTLCLLCSVSKLWRSLAEHDTVWRILHQEYFDEETPNGEEEISSWKQFFKDRALSDPFFDLKAEQILSTLPDSVDDRRIRITFLGSDGSGKSALGLRFTQGIYVPNHDTYIADLLNKKIKLHGHVETTMEIFDTVEETGMAMKELFIKNSDGCVLNYAIDAEHTFHRATFYYDKVMKMKGGVSYPILLVGSKKDLEDRRAVKEDKAAEWAKARGIPFIEVSAKTGENVDTALLAIARMIMRTKVFANDSPKAKGRCLLS